MADTIAGAGGGAGPVTPTLAGGAASLLTSDQQEFGAQLAADTGLNPDVIAAWLLSEQSGSAADYYQGENFNDWLNIGVTGSGDYGTSDSIWDNPVSAANATAEWLEGKNSVAGYNVASSGIQSILSSVKGSAQQQITALQDSGWAGSGYPQLASVYSEVTGAGGATANATPYAPASVTGTTTSRPSGSGGNVFDEAVDGLGSFFAGIPGAVGSGVTDAVQLPGSLASDLNPASVLTSIWASVLGDAKYAAVFCAALLIGCVLIIKGVGHNGVQVPQIIPIPVGGGA